MLKRLFIIFITVTVAMPIVSEAAVRRHLGDHEEGSRDRSRAPQSSTSFEELFSGFAEHNPGNQRWTEITSNFDTWSVSDLVKATQQGVEYTRELSGRLEELIKALRRVRAPRDFLSFAELLDPKRDNAVCKSFVAALLKQVSECAKLFWYIQDWEISNRETFPTEKLLPPHLREEAGEISFSMLQMCHSHPELLEGEDGDSAEEIELVKARFRNHEQLYILGARGSRIKVLGCLETSALISVFVHSTVLCIEVCKLWGKIESSCEDERRIDDAVEAKDSWFGLMKMFCDIGLPGQKAEFLSHIPVSESDQSVDSLLGRINYVSNIAFLIVPSLLGGEPAFFLEYWKRYKDILVDDNNGELSLKRGFLTLNSEMASKSIQLIKKSIKNDGRLGAQLKPLTKLLKRRLGVIRAQENLTQSCTDLFQAIQLLDKVTQGFHSTDEDMLVVQKSQLELACCRLALSQSMPPAKHLSLQREFHQKVQELLEFVKTKEELGSDRDRVVVTTTTTTASQVASEGLVEFESTTMEQDFRELGAESRRIANEIRRRIARKESAKAHKPKKIDRRKKARAKQSGKGTAFEDQVVPKAKGILGRITVVSGEGEFGKEGIQKKIKKLNKLVDKAENLADLKKKCKSGGYNMKKVTYGGRELWSFRINKGLRITCELIDHDQLKAENTTFSNHYGGCNNFYRNLGSV